ncbi:membrane protein, predicted to be involved in aromatic hydrocarbon degradation [Desulfococcus multivorans]|nr:membrane protein, predicted to be involved in aromatic hydrocarbon degradation [Desulfococcus multivorans]
MAVVKNERSLYRFRHLYDRSSLCQKRDGGKGDETLLSGHDRLPWGRKPSEKEKGENQMKKRLFAVILLSLFLEGTAFASAYRIPEQSADATAKAGAHTAAAVKADSTYYNPANMAWAADAWQGEIDLTYLHLTAIEYRDARSSRFDGDSDKENFLLPTLFIVSPDYNGFRFGFSITEPYGLAKCWEDPFPKTFAEEFELKVIEFNPTAAYRFNDYISIAGGVRFLYNDASVKSSGVVTPTGLTATRDLEGDTTEWGYNLALSVRPNSNSNIAVTYRSNVDLDFEGDAVLGTNLFQTTVKTDAEVTVPAPAVLTIAGAYTFDKLTVELQWDRTFWSEYETLDFNYDTPLMNPVLAAFDQPIPKDWDDTDAFRIGLTYQMTNVVALMAGFAYDENPAPDDTLGFELPDSDAWLYSLGARFTLNPNMEIGVGFLYDYKEGRTVTNEDIDGTFDDAAAFLLTTGFTYTF